MLKHTDTALNDLNYTGRQTLNPQDGTSGTVISSTAGKRRRDCQDQETAVKETTKSSAEEYMYSET